MLHQGEERIALHRVDLPLPERARLEEAYRRLRPKYEEALQELQLRLRSELTAIGLDPTVKWRVKSFDSCFSKLVRRVREAGEHSDTMELTDLLGIRFVCPFLEDIERIEQRLRDRYEVLEVERKGSKYSFHEFGYDSTHYLIRMPAEIARLCGLPQELSCELQLRTILQDAWAEVEHELIYKADFSPLDDPLRRKLAALNANLSLSDTIFQEIRDYQRELQRELEKRRGEFWHRYHSIANNGGAGAGEQPDAAAPHREPRAREEISHHDPSPREQISHGGSVSGGRPDGTESARRETPRGESARAAEHDRGNGEGRTSAASLRNGQDLGDTLDNLLLRALLEHNRRNFGRAIEIYDRLLEQHPRAEVEAVICAHRGMAYFAEGLHQDAIADFTRALELVPDNPKALYYRGVVYRVLDRTGDALADLDACLYLDPYHFDGSFARAQLYYDLGDYVRALNDCDRALEIHPESQQAIRFRSLIASLVAR